MEAHVKWHRANMYTITVVGDQAGVAHRHFQGVAGEHERKSPLVEYADVTHAGDTTSVKVCLTAKASQKFPPALVSAYVAKLNCPVVYTHPGMTRRGSKGRPEPVPRHELPKLNLSAWIAHRPSS